MKFAYFGFPHLGGTYSVFRHLRAGLGARGIDVEWLGLGPLAEAAAAAPAWRGEAACGLAVPACGDQRDDARRLVAAIEHGYDGIFVNVLADRVQTNAVRYLGDHLMRVMIVHNITPATYAAAAAIRRHVHATVGVSERIRSDLVRRHGFDPEWTVAIPNASDTTPSVPTPAERGGGLRLLYVGRIEDQAKGVLWLPRLMRRLPAGTSLTVAGDGPDLTALRASLEGLGSRATCLGAVTPEQAMALYRSHHVLLMPSRFEGSPLVLFEAMARGCVPVASRIVGVTDTVVTDGLDGYLFPVGDLDAAAAAVLRLLDPAKLEAMAQNARAAVEDRFNSNTLAARYAQLIERLSVQRPQIAPPLRLDSWRMAWGLRAGLRTYLPRPLKNLARTLRERAAT